MEYILKTSCKTCDNNEIIVRFYYDKEEKMMLTSHGICSKCLSNIILPVEPYKQFIEENICYKRKI